MSDVSSNELFRMAIEKVFVSLKGLSEAKEMIQESRKRAEKEDEVPGGGMKEELGAAVKEAMSAVMSIYGGDNLIQNLSQCIRNLSIELVDLGGVQLEFSGVKVVVEKIQSPRVMGLPEVGRPPYAQG